MQLKMIMVVLEVALMVVVMVALTVETLTVVVMMAHVQVHL